MENAGTISAEFYEAEARQEYDDGGGRGMASVAPEQVVVEECEGSRKAKFTTSYGDPEYQPPPMRNNGGGMKTRYMRAGGNFAQSVAKIIVHYRDLDTLISRKIVPIHHAPVWLERYRQQQVQQRAQAARPQTFTINLAAEQQDKLQPGEMVDLT
eukprot:COSAG04_NODE_732_length_10723_cov_5.273155_8_plen_155_part_00